jgi:CDP-6-deoxy-D-xylo-4-hexulose-3-dehydrase
MLSGKVWFPNPLDDTFTASFCIPVIMDTVEKKNKLIEALKQHNIECRPLISGSMGIQPFYKKTYGENKLPNCSTIDNRGIYVPNHPQLTEAEIELMCNLIIECNA